MVIDCPPNDTEQNFKSYGPFTTLIHAFMCRDRLVYNAYHKITPLSPTATRVRRDEWKRDAYKAYANWGHMCLLTVRVDPSKQDCMPANQGPSFEEDNDSVDVIYSSDDEEIVPATQPLKEEGELTDE